jgi:hypothetical protein
MKKLFWEVVHGMVVISIFLWIVLLPFIIAARIGMWCRKRKFLRRHRNLHQRDPTIEDWKKFHRDEVARAYAEDGPSETRRGKLLTWGTIVGSLIFFYGDGDGFPTFEKWSSAIIAVLGVTRLLAWLIYKLTDKPPIVPGSWEDDSFTKAAQTEPGNDQQPIEVREYTFTKVLARPLILQSESSYFVHLDETVRGPYTARQIQLLFKVNSIGADTPICLSGSEEWRKLSDFEERDVVHHTADGMTADP